MTIKKAQSVKMMFRGMDSNKKVEKYIEKRLQKINQLTKNVLEFEVEIDRDKKNLFRVELMAKTAHKLYRTEEISQSIEGSADIACEELAAQVIKDKDKTRDLKRRGLRSIKKKIILSKDARF